MRERRCPPDFVVRLNALPPMVDASRSRNLVPHEISDAHLSMESLRPFFHERAQRSLVDRLHRQRIFGLKLLPPARSFAPSVHPVPLALGTLIEVEVELVQVAKIPEVPGFRGRAAG